MQFSLVAASRDYCVAVGFNCGGFSLCRARTLDVLQLAGALSTGSAVVVYELNSSMTCEIFPDQDPNPVLCVGRQIVFSTVHQGSPVKKSLIMNSILKMDTKVFEYFCFFLC